MGGNTCDDVIIIEAKESKFYHLFSFSSGCSRVFKQNLFFYMGTLLLGEEPFFMTLSQKHFNALGINASSIIFDTK